MARSTLLVALTTLAVVLVVAARPWLPPARLALGVGCAGGLALLSARRRRALQTLVP
jgi:hypothetical protein